MQEDEVRAQACIVACDYGSVTPVNFIHCLHPMNGAMPTTLLDSVMALPQVLPVLLPELQSIVSLPCTDSCQMQQQALAVIRTFISSLGTMSGQYGQQTRELIQPHLEGLMQQLLAILSQPQTPKDTSCWGVLMEAIKSLIQIMLHLSKSVSTL